MAYQPFGADSTTGQLPAVVEARISALAAAAITGATQSVVVYASGAYAARPTGAASVLWIGPTEPPAMAANVDEWTQVTL